MRMYIKRPEQWLTSVSCMTIEVSKAECVIMVAIRKHWNLVTEKALLAALDFKPFKNWRVRGLVDTNNAPSQNAPLSKGITIAHSDRIVSYLRQLKNVTTLVYTISERRRHKQKEHVYLMCSLRRVARPNTAFCVRCSDFARFSCEKGHLTLCSLRYKAS